MSPDAPPRSARQGRRPLRAALLGAAAIAGTAAVLLSPGAAGAGTATAPPTAVTTPTTAATVTAPKTATVATQTPKPTASVNVSATPVGPAIPDGFVGLATRYWDIPTLAGTNPKALDQPFEQALANLAPSGSLTLRIGGDTADWSWWPLASIKKPKWVRFSITPKWAAIVRRLTIESHAKLILGINLEGDNRAISEHEIAELKAHIGLSHITAFEVGNEPELYSKYPFYYKGKIAIKGRPTTYQGTTLVANWDWMVDGLMRGVPLAGPGFTSFNEPQDEEELLQSTKRLSLLTVHSYPLKSARCNGDRQLQEDELFEPSSLQALAAQAAQWTHNAARYKVPLRVDEMNAVTCGGTPDYSDSFGPALWALNILPMFARAGVDGVNFDTVPGTLQDLIQSVHSASGWGVEVQPEYYGLVAFAQLTPPGSRLLSVGTAPDGMLLWAVRTPAKQTHVVITNPTSTKQVVAVDAAGVSGAGTVTHLSAPHGLKSTQGVTLGGQTVIPGTGRLGGTAQNTIVDETNGHYVVTVPAASAAILTVG